MPYRRQVVVGLALMAVGASLLAVPASGEGPVLVPISEGHGLSAIDAAGAALLAVAGTWLEVLVVGRRGGRPGPGRGSADRPHGAPVTRGAGRAEARRCRRRRAQATIVTHPY